MYSLPVIATLLRLSTTRIMLHLTESSFFVGLYSVSVHLCDDPWIIIHCIPEITEVATIAHLFWTLPDNPWIHCILELLGWLAHWMSDDPLIHCINKLLGWLTTLFLPEIENQVVRKRV